jgi:hypothetical protein
MSKEEEIKKNEQEIEKEREKKIEQALITQAMKVLFQGSKYVEVLLRDYVIKEEVDFAGDPLTLTIRVHINETKERIKEKLKKEG